MRDGEKSFARIFEIIELIASSRNGLKGKEISHRTSIPQSTVFRMLKFLVERRYLISQEQYYCLGPVMARFGEIAASQNSLVRLMRPFLLEISEQTNETVHLGKLQEDQVVYIDKVEGKRSVRMGSMIGRTSPLYCTGIGKAMLAFLPEERKEAVFETIEWVRFTPQTICTENALKKELCKIVRQGYALDDCEHEKGVFCVAAPVLDAEGYPVCALSISGSELYLRDKAVEYARLLQREIYRFQISADGFL